MLQATASNRSVLMIEAVAAARLGQKGLARRLFNEIVEKDPTSEHAMLWLAALADTPDESVRALEQVLIINPQNEHAIKALEVQKLHLTAKPTEVPLPPPTTRALAAGPFQSPTRMLRSSASDAKNGRDAVSAFGPQPTMKEQSEAPKPAPQFQRAIRKVSNCPICQAEHLMPPARCSHCGCYLTLDNLSQINENRGAEEDILKGAIEVWKARLGSDPFNANLNMARALLSLHRSAEALVTLHAALTQQPEDAELRKFAGALESRKLIVAVDDSQTIRKLVAVHLERKGYRVLTVEDGVEALNRFAEFKPDLVLLDVSLPKVDGYEICRILRKDPDLKCVPIVMLSGRDGFFDRVRGKLAGANDYLTKPFDVIALMKTLNKHLAAK